MSAAVASDSVPLEALAGGAGGAAVEKAANQCTRPRSHTVKLYLSILLIFIFVVSQVFVGNVLSSFGEKAVVGRTPTSWGVCLQAIFMVIGYAIATYLISHGVV